MAYTFTGEVGRTYPAYLDVTDPARVKTLDAAPGGVYEIRPAAGSSAPVPPADGLWKPAAKKTEKKGED